MNFEEKRQQAFRELEDKRSQASLGGGEARIAAQHKRGKMSARNGFTSFSTLAHLPRSMRL